MKEIYVVIPFYNESLEVLKSTVRGLSIYFKNIILVNDGGAKEIKKAIEGLPVYYLRHVINLGQGAALQTGMEFALHKGADIIVHFDADGQHNPEDALQMISYLESEKLDIVLGSRFLKKEHANAVPLLRRIMIKVGVIINFLFTGLWMSDAHHGLRVMNKYMASKVEFKENRQLHATEILSIIKKHDFSYKEYPAKVVYSSYSIHKGQKNIHFIKIMKELILSRFMK